MGQKEAVQLYITILFGKVPSFRCIFSSALLYYFAWIPYSGFRVWLAKFEQNRTLCTCWMGYTRVIYRKVVRINKIFGILLHTRERQVGI